MKVDMSRCSMVQHSDGNTKADSWISISSNLTAVLAGLKEGWLIHDMLPQQHCISFTGISGERHNCATVCMLLLLPPGGQE